MPKLSVDEQYLNYELGRLEAKLRHMKGIEVGRAQAAALNKSAAKVSTGTVRATASKLSIKQKLIRQRVRINRASSKKLEAGIKVNTRGIPMIKLNAREVPGGVQAGAYLQPDAFIATATSAPKGSTKGRKNPASQLIGKTQVFKRKGKGRYPLRAVTVEIAKVVKENTIKTASSAMRHDIARLLKHEYEYRILKRMPK